MEKPIPPNPDTMTDEEFDRWLEAEFIWESEQIEKALFPDGIPEDTSTPEGEQPPLFFTHMKKCITIYAVLFLQNCRSKRAFFIYLQILHFIYANKFKTKGTRRRTGKA